MPKYNVVLGSIFGQYVFAPSNRDIVLSLNIYTLKYFIEYIH